MRKLPTLKESLQESYEGGGDDPSMEESMEEAAIGAPEARNQKLALFVDRNRGKAYLYEVDKTPWTREGQRKNPVRVLGYISLGQSGWGSYPTFFNSVNLSASEPKYGPLMYDIGLGMKYPEWVMSDRGSISKSARRVWSHYLNNRPDVERIFLPDHLRGTVDSLFEKLVDRFGGTKDFLRMAEDALRVRRTSCVPYNAPSETEIPMARVLTRALARIRAQEQATPEWTDQDQEKAEKVVIESLREMDEVLRKEPLCWAFRLRAPENAQKGPALAQLLSSHKDNLRWAQGSSSGLAEFDKKYLETLISNQGRDLFDEKYLGSGG